MNDVEESKRPYLNKIFIYLIILLCTCQYTSESCLLFLVIINYKNEKKSKNDNEINKVIEIKTEINIFQFKNNLRLIIYI